MIQTISRCGLAAAVVALSACQTAPPVREGTLPLDKALQEIRTSLDNFRPKKDEEPLGLWLTDVQIVLKVQDGRGSTKGLETTIPGDTLVGTKLTISNTTTNSLENTITINFKNPYSLGKDTIAAVVSTPPAKADAKDEKKSTEKQAAAPTPPRRTPGDGILPVPPQTFMLVPDVRLQGGLGFLPKE